jgi:hypothetical protein
MSDEMQFAKAYQAIGKYFCAFSALDRELGEVVKVVLGLESHPAANFVVAALRYPTTKADLARAAVAVATVDGSETSSAWKENANKVIADIYRCNTDDRVWLAHSYLEPQADGSITLTKHGRLEPKTWNVPDIENKIRQVRDLTEKLQKIGEDLSTLTIRIPDLPDLSWFMPLSEPGLSR